MKRLQIMILVAAAVFSNAISLQADDTVKDILSKDSLIRGKAVKRISDDRKALIASLIEIVENNNASIESRIIAIDVLGIIRAEEATEVLLRNVLIGEQLDKGSTELIGGFVQDLPAVRALILIRMEPVKAILSQRNDYLKKELDKKTLKIYAYIIEKVLTPPMAKAVLEDLAQRETDPVRKDNVVNMLKIRFYR